MKQGSRLWRGHHRVRPRQVFVLAVGLLAVAGLALESPAAATPDGVAAARGAPAPAAAATLTALASTTNGPIGCTRGHPAPQGSVRCTPVRGTPHFPAHSRRTEQVRQLVQCGSRMYAVGTFRSVIGFSARRHAMVTFHRRNAFSFSATRPFAVSSWNPNVNGEVNSVALGPGCTSAYLGGSFSKVHGRTAHRIVRVNTSAGSVRTGFRRNANDTVETLLRHGNRLLAGGFFTAINGSHRRYYVSLNTATGRDDSYLRLAVHGHYHFPGVSANRTRVYNQQLSHGGTRLLAEGDFTSAGGKHRQQIFMLILGASRARVTSWTSSDFNHNCWGKESFYVRDASWAPNDKTIYIGTTGFHPAGGSLKGRRTGLCDAAAAFPATLHQVRHRWRNYTGCDSLYSTAAGSSTVYFGGHERWADNRFGCDHRGPGAIRARGMVGLSTSGAVTFAPGRARGKGADDMVLTSRGLWIASDNFDGSQSCGGVQGLAGICFLPYPSG
jgi:hypothetical protein